MQLPLYGKIVDGIPPLKPVKHYLDDLYGLQYTWEGDWSTIRPEAYDFFDLLGGPRNLKQVFIEILFFNFLRHLIQGQPFSHGSVGSMPMGQFQQRAFFQSRPHFKFLWDFNLTSNSADYFRHTAHEEDYRINLNFQPVVLLYDPGWIEDWLRDDILSWLVSVRKDLNQGDEPLPLFGFPLSEPGLAEDRKFLDILWKPRDQAEHCATLGESSVVSGHFNTLQEIYGELDLLSIPRDSS